MKTWIWTIILLVLLGAYAAYGADIRYSFEPVTAVNVISENDKGERVAWRQDPPGVGGFKAIFTDAKGKDKVFECSSLFDTVPAKINAKGDIAGSCGVGGFIRDRKGALSFVNAPGAHNTYLWGINSHGQAVGNYDAHGFVWDGNSGNKVVTIDVPVVNSVTTLLGIDDAGRVVGEYYTINPITNETSAAVSFMYNNGQFSPIVFPGSKFTDVQDINSFGQIVGNSDVGIFFLDDGRYYTIPPPEGYKILSVDNIDDDARILGWYKKIVVCDTFQCGPPAQRFLATQMIARSNGKGTVQWMVDLRHAPITAGH